MTTNTDTTRLIFMLPKDMLDGVNVETFHQSTRILCGQEVQHGWGAIGPVTVARLTLTAEDDWWLLAGDLTPNGERMVRQTFGDHPLQWSVQPLIHAASNKTLVGFMLLPWVSS